ncbi:phenoloxidase-activating factor 2-like [Anopheles ziemanni]|uniref:phenoloxidase-activating factor 2-like n=1 Tax=Anopheles coustani TaxID=139045 RepID=UPI0026586D9C|nr:phenoloxidase-activating factor 2-like [Anopheles coustani]XP_058170385.1 phenoloxidase-activating factor 2-like [Anopheles ziemanni]
MFLNIGLVLGLCLAMTSATQKCGERNVDGVGFRVVDPQGESEYGEFPWMAVILSKENLAGSVFNVYQCGGSLIHPSVVLTAASCVQNKAAAKTLVRLGEWDTQTRDEIYPHQDRQVHETVIHSGFNKTTQANNVALLFLEKPAELMETVDTICLPPMDQHIGTPRCFASGYGMDVAGANGRYQVILKKIEVPIVPSEKCQKALRTTSLGQEFVIHSSLICAGGEEGRNMCKGDTGSPLVCPIPGTVNRYYQAGIVMDGSGCGENRIPVLYANVPKFREWIEGHLTQRNMSHSYFNYS